MINWLDLFCSQMHDTHYHADDQQYYSCCLHQQDGLYHRTSWKALPDNDTRFLVLYIDLFFVNTIDLFMVEHLLLCLSQLHAQWMTHNT